MEHLYNTLEELEEEIKSKAPDLDDVYYFKDPSYVTAIIGFDSLTNAVIYDFNLMCEYLVTIGEFDDLNEAADYIDWNLSFGFNAGENAILPIIRVDNVGL